MKYIVIAFSLISFCVKSTLFSMDPYPFKDQMITAVCDSINKHYPPSLLNILFGHNLTTTVALDVINLAKRHFIDDIPTPMIDQLCEQNTCFNSAINHFIALAHSNLDLISPNNLATIANQNAQQPTPALNNLPFTIKEYVMNCALDQVKYEYDIVLRNEHKDPITAFDICEITHQAATSSCREVSKIHELFKAFKYSNNDSIQWNNVFFLWNLKTSKPMHKFDEPMPISILAFHPNGEYISAAFACENKVKTWSTNTKQALHTFDCSHPVGLLSYPSATLPILCAKTFHHTTMTQYILAPMETKTGEYIGGFNIFAGRGQDSSFPGKKYDARHPVHCLKKNTELWITNKKCPILYLCTQARKKMDNPTIEKIEKMALFHQLTDTEKNIIRTIQ